jgi:hypothetical protein
VVRKGSREIAQLPASTDAFVWLRLYQLETAEEISRGRTDPLWRTLRRPPRPLSYHAVHRMFERVNERAGTSATLHSLRGIVKLTLIMIFFAEANTQCQPVRRT